MQHKIRCFFLSKFETFHVMQINATHRAAVTLLFVTLKYIFEDLMISDKTLFEIKIAIRVTPL